MALLDVRPQQMMNFNYTDIADGYGYISYYLFSTEETTNVEYELGTSIIRSSIPYIEHHTVGNVTKTFYGPSFLLPKLMEGTIFFTFGAWIQGSNNTGLDTEIKIYHYDGTTSTQLGSTWTSPRLNTAAGAIQQTYTGKVEASRTKFKIGDQIKIEVKLIVFTADSSTAGIGIDPEDEEVQGLSVGNSQFKMNFPFKLNV